MSAIDLQRANALLAALPAVARQRVLARCKPCSLAFGDVLYDPGDRITHVYFPVNALISLLALVEGHLALEVGMIGWEGMLGIPLVLNVKNSPVRALVQGSGEAWRMPAALFLKEFERNKPLQRAVFGFTNSLMQQIAQSAACNRFHQVEARLARWLLMTRDRVGAREFRLTHSFWPACWASDAKALRKPQTAFTNATWSNLDAADSLFSTKRVWRRWLARATKPSGYRQGK